jgi:hypothetical protein
MAKKSNGEITVVALIISELKDRLKAMGYSTIRRSNTHGQVILHIQGFRKTLGIVVTPRTPWKSNKAQSWEICCRSDQMRTTYLLWKNKHKVENPEFGVDYDALMKDIGTFLNHMKNIEKSLKDAHALFTNVHAQNSWGDGTGPSLYYRKTSGKGYDPDKKKVSKHAV